MYTNTFNLLCYDDYGDLCLYYMFYWWLTCVENDLRIWCWRPLLMSCFTQILNFIVMSVPCVTCPHSFSLIHNWFIPWLMTKTCEIEEPFPLFNPYAWWIPCFVSRLWVVQQNLSKPWSFWARWTHWYCFLRLDKLGFEALTSLFGWPWCLVLTVDIPP